MVKSISASLVGSVIGTFAFSWLIGWLDKRYSISASDMPMWIWYSVPVGAVLGGMSGLVVRWFAEGEFRKAGIRAAICGLLLSPLAYSHAKDAIYQLQYLSAYHTAGYVLAQALPFLIWWVLFLLVGLAALRKD